MLCGQRDRWHGGYRCDAPDPARWLGLHRLFRWPGGVADRVEQVVQPPVAFVPGDVQAGPADHDGVLDAGDGGQCVVDAGLGGDDGAVAPGAILGDQDPWREVGEAFGESFDGQRHREYGEHGPDTGAGEHRYDGFG
jgi:hypothetical protein